ncbi:MAG TPA: hypothetical protein VEF34_14275 [Syntrophobacteraceae bacterium]|nr:hypothetical protein [Syntrophobacteraceae bacterium]
MKKIALILTIAFLAMTAMPVLAGEALPPDPTLTGRFTAEPAGEFIIFDALVLRPLGLAALGLGAVTSVVAYPMSGPSHSEDRVTRELIQKPYSYTFCRPIGDIDF